MRKHAVEMEFCRHLEITPKPPGVTSLDFLEPTQKYALNWERAPFCSLGKASQRGGHPISDSRPAAAQQLSTPCSLPSGRRARVPTGFGFPQNIRRGGPAHSSRPHPAEQLRAASSAASGMLPGHENQFPWCPGVSLRPMSFPSSQPGDMRPRQSASS